MKTITFGCEPCQSKVNLKGADNDVARLSWSIEEGDFGTFPHCVRDDEDNVWSNERPSECPLNGEHCPREHAIGNVATLALATGVFEVIKRA